METIANRLYKVLASSLLLAVSLNMQAGPVLTFPRDRSSSVAVIVRDLSTGENIVSSNPDKAMLPASTLKCVTAAAALEAKLDTAHIVTPVYLRGPVNDGVLDGDLIIMGMGDPTTDSAQFPSSPSFLERVARAVADSGITHIRGEIIIDESGFPDSGPNARWELSDTKYEYGAGLYGLNFRDNRRGDKAMPSPSETFGEALETRLNELGVTVDWEETPSAEAGLVEIYRHSSPAGGDILRNLMVRSDNLFAEAMLRRLASGRPLSEAIAKERKLLANAGVNLDVTDIYDGSGLSRNDRVTARVLADLLTTMAPRKGAEVAYVDLFPKVGRDGTVKTILNGTALEGRLALKSGSMNGVHCYAGYKLDANGEPTHVVVILVNDFFCKRADVRNAITGFLQKTFKQ